MFLIYPAKFTRHDNGYDVVLPDFEGALTFGGNIDEAFLLVQDLLGCLAGEYRSKRIPLPPPSALAPHGAAEDGSFYSLVGVDTETFNSRFDEYFARASANTDDVGSYGD